MNKGIAAQTLAILIIGIVTMLVVIGIMMLGRDSTSSLFGGLFDWIRG